jgi:hypothetical protein
MYMTASPEVGWDGEIAIFTGEAKAQGLQIDPVRQIVQSLAE